MRTECYSEEEPWTRSVALLAEGRIGRIAALSVHQGCGDIVEAQRGWDARVRELLGEPLRRDELAVPGALSVLARYPGEVTVRLFFDIAGPAPFTCFEIVGSRRMIRLGLISLDHPHAAGDHFPALRLIKDRVSVRAIAHPNRARAVPWPETFGANWTAERDALLHRGDIDAVLVTSTNHRHAADEIDGLRTVEFVAAAYEAARSGERRRVQRSS